MNNTQTQKPNTNDKDQRKAWLLDRMAKAGWTSTGEVKDGMLVWVAKK